MGLDATGIRLLLLGRNLGVDFTRTATLGRQWLCATSSDLQEISAEWENVLSQHEIAKICGEDEGFAGGFFRFLGAERVESFDHSSYEGATHLHDANTPIAEEFYEKYSVVVDGGTLEHVFNFPQALQNAMRMVAIGGHYIGIAPANNCFGHGFYQFSPELYFRCFTRENGFDLLRLYLVPQKKATEWLLVRDPGVLGRRNSFDNGYENMLLVIAKKTSSFEGFRIWPQQSDYEAVWKQADKPPDFASLCLIKKAVFWVRVLWHRANARLQKGLGHYSKDEFSVIKVQDMRKQ
jgi:hypothetical protein